MHYRKVLLSCGILSSLLWIGGDILAARLYEGYSYTNQTISELSAVGASTRSLLVSLDSLYEVLLFAFGLGVLAGGGKRYLRFTGILLITHATLAPRSLQACLHHGREFTNALMSMVTCYG